MNLKWLKAAALSGLLLGVYADAAHRDEQANQRILAAVSQLHGGWHP
ncbi:MAG: hypothetical protein K2X55_27355 [Burkholderiaceae bacterium]|nr:hypothetical protein [Burkholderiaceae bacterium]